MVSRHTHKATKENSILNSSYLELAHATLGCGKIVHARRKHTLISRSRKHRSHRLCFALWRKCQTKMHTLVQLAHLLQLCAQNERNKIVKITWCFELRSQISTKTRSREKMNCDASTIVCVWIGDSECKQCTHFKCWSLNSVKLRKLSNVKQFQRANWTITKLCRLHSSKNNAMMQWHASGVMTLVTPNEILCFCSFRLLHLTLHRRCLSFYLNCIHFV